MERDEILRILLDWNYWGDYEDESIERGRYIKELNRLLKTSEIVVIKGVVDLIKMKAIYWPDAETDLGVKCVIEEIPEKLGG